MVLRKYDRRSRLAAAEETRRSIVRATVKLHAQHGGLGTTHEMIARLAGVSLPTVYKYFPTRNDLIPHCTGQVMGESAVRLDESLFAGKDDVPTRLRALAQRAFELHAYLAPWLRWSARDATELPALRAVLEEAARGRSALLRVALKPGFDSSPPRRLVALAIVLLDFASWQALTEHGFTSKGASAAVGDALVSLYTSTRRDNHDQQR